ncbi:hypothetical protein CRT23_15175 [Methylobacterium sp. V23]|nr:hypothetical protein CRT23_15175 [Methylobacterium sp. V23]
MRQNEAPSWETRQAQINAEERVALAGLRKRIKAQIRSDLDRVDRCLNALNLIDGDADIEQDAGEMPESAGVCQQYDDDEPSLGGLTVDAQFARCPFNVVDVEEDVADEPQHDDAEISGVGDGEGYAEQFPFLNSSFGAYA